MALSPNNLFSGTASLLKFKSTKIKKRKKIKDDFEHTTAWYFQKLPFPELYVSWFHYTFANVLNPKIQVKATNPQPIWTTLDWNVIRTVGYIGPLPDHGSTGWLALYETIWGPFPPGEWNIGLIWTVYGDYTDGPGQLSKPETNIVQCNNL
jgi:hypothetical protein